MTTSRGSDPEVGLLRMLRTALEAGLRPDADDEAFAGARSAAQIIGLPGLDACLGALEPRRGTPWAGDALELVEFLRTLVSGSDLRGIRAVETELEARAALVRRPQGARDGAANEALQLAGSGAPNAERSLAIPPPGWLTAGEALAEVPLAGDRDTDRASLAWLSPHVAAALRAALEWLDGGTDRPRPFRLRAEDSVLEAVCERVSPTGLAPAHEVLAAADGNLAPLAETGVHATAGSWVVRVPAWSPRPVHLMLEQGGLRLALPWHAVLRLSMVPSIELEMRGDTLATPVLEPLAPLESGLGERPVVAIAHGIRRGLLVADRLIWRLGAESCEPPGVPPVAGLRTAVRSDDEEIFWIADPAFLMRALPLPGLPPGTPAPSAPAAPPRSGPPVPRPAPTSEPLEPAGSALTLEDPPVLTAADVESLALTAADVEPLDRPVAGPAEPEPPVLPDWLERFGSTGGPARVTTETGPRSIPRPAPPAVLIAEDSLAARHFLSRLFERRGLVVEAVESAAALREALGRRAWSLVCVDVELPDAAGTAMLEEVRRHAALADVPIVALVRDDEDAGRAVDAGVRRWLRKPFDGDEVDHLIGRLGLAGGVRS